VASSPRSRQHGASAQLKRFGSETPRIFTPPLRELTPETTEGFSVIEFAENVLDIELYPWQKWLLIHALELREDDDTFRFRTLVVLVARQNGKSTLSQVLALWFLYVYGYELVIGTAQDLDVAEEIWQGAVDIVEDTPELNALKLRVVKGAGKKSLDLKSGNRYKVKAANRRAGRGLSGDLILLDELREHTSWDSWGAITKTTMARANAQIWALSNAGDAASIVLRYLRKMAHAAIGDPDGINLAGGIADSLPDDEEDVDLIDDEDSLGIFEWSARPGCSTTDRDGWAMANPSLGYSITERTVGSAQKTDPEWVFRTEVLCQWSDGSLVGPFPPGSWDAGFDLTSYVPDEAPIVYCLDVSVQRTWSYIGWAGKNTAGQEHVELMEARAGVDWVIPWFTKGCAVKPMTVVVQAKGAQASSLIPDLHLIDGLTVIEWGGSGLGDATAKILDLVDVNGLKHLPQARLDLAAGTAELRKFADGAQVWDRFKSPTDASPLVAVTGALWGLGQVKVPFRSKYEDAGLTLV
jgi:hypothetical protein